jgi:hypothetical protein
MFLFFCIVFFSCKDKDRDDTSRTDQVITFGPISNKKLVENSFKLQAWSSSGLSVLFESSDPSIASISGNIINMHLPGSITITAFQPGNKSYNPATPVEQSFNIQPPLLASYETDLFFYYYSYNFDLIIEYGWEFKLNGTPFSRSLIYNDSGEMIEDISSFSTKITKRNGNTINYGSETLTLDNEGKLLLIESTSTIKFEYDNNGNLSRKTEYNPDDMTVISIEAYEDYDLKINPLLESKPRWWFTYINRFFAFNNPGRLIKTENETSSVIEYQYEYNSLDFPTKRIVYNQETKETHTEIYLYEEPDIMPELP